LFSVGFVVVVIDGNRFDRVQCLETKVVELTNENEALKAKLQLMLSKVNMNESEMEHAFEEEQRLGRICLKPVTSASLMLGQRSSHSDDDEPCQRLKNSSSSETHEDDDDDDDVDDNNQSNTATVTSDHQQSPVDLSRADVKTGNLLGNPLSETLSPLTPSPSPPNESLLQILANQMLTDNRSQAAASRLLKIVSPNESKPHQSSLKRNLQQYQQSNEQQQKWDDAAMTLLSLNKPIVEPARVPLDQQTALQSVCQSVINGLLRKPPPPKVTIDYRATHQQLQMHGENFHQQEQLSSLAQWKTLMNYFSAPSMSMSTSACVSEQINTPVTSSHVDQTRQRAKSPIATVTSTSTGSSSHVHRSDMMPLKLRMKMLNARS
jgi:hypothetical protein